ncbi:MAG: hypothetical protein DME43_05020 [Verrucomicrobia bacterium]|nr:MAG: hypothetical protein DME43_05020 [Verrucomicrobiota bacterium]
MKNSRALQKLFRAAHTSRVLAMASRHHGLFWPKMPATFVSARRRNQHAKRVRYPSGRANA